MDIEQHQTAIWQKEARMGQAMSNLENNPDFHVFKTEILEQIKEQALRILTDSPADDHVAIVGGQQRRKVVLDIETEMTSLIEQGRLATSYLNNSNTEDSDI